jgi:hypothetical protein
MRLNVTFQPGYICMPFNSSVTRVVPIIRFENDQSATFTDTLTGRQKVPSSPLFLLLGCCD